MKRFFIFFLSLVGCWPSVVNACEGCKMAATNGFKEPQTILAGLALSWSVLFLLAVVFLLLAVLAWSIRSACQARIQASKG